MILTRPIPFIAKRKRVQIGAPTPPALVLSLAVFEDAHWLYLKFDRAVDIAAIDPAQIIVDDYAISGERYAGFGATLENSNTAKVEMGRIDNAHDPGTHLFASASTGIVAVDDGGTWAGADGVVLPFS